MQPAQALPLSRCKSRQRSSHHLAFRRHIRRRRQRMAPPPSVPPLALKRNSHSSKPSSVPPLAPQQTAQQYQAIHAVVDDARASGWRSFSDGEDEASRPQSPADGATLSALLSPEAQQSQRIRR